MTKTYFFILFFFFCYSCEQKVAPRIAVIKALPAQEIVCDEFENLAYGFLDSLSSELFSLECPGVAVSIVHDNRTLVMEGIGVEDNISQQLIIPESVFRLGSVSKGFAAILTHIMVKKGFLSYDDPVVKYVPEFILKNPENSEKITVHNLLSQSTGLPPHTYTNYLESGSSISEILPMLQNVNTVADTGTICTYQNVAYALIERILEKATGVPYPTLLENEIFIPLQMHQASTTCDAMANSEHKSSPHKFTGGEKKYMPVAYNEKYYNAVSAGGINASIKDMNTYMQLLLGNKPGMLSTNDLRSFFAPNVASDYEYRYFHRWKGLTHDYYGLGWRIFDYSGETWAYHGGFVNAFRSEIAINLRRKVGICMLFNASCGLPDYAMKIFFDRFSHEISCNREQL